MIKYKNCNVYKYIKCNPFEMNINESFRKKKNYYIELPLWWKIFVEISQKLLDYHSIWNMQRSRIER